MPAVIHPTAIVAAGAELADGVQIGPYSIIGADVALGEGVEVGAHVAMDGRVSVGARTRIFPFAAIGFAPQDTTYRDEPSRVVIGADCEIREGVTIHRGTKRGTLETWIGNGCLLYGNSHVAHDCRLGDRVIMSNGAMIAGHVHVGDFVIFGGHAGVQQRVHIGAHAFVGGLSGVVGDVIPYGMVLGDRARLGGLNLIGLKRRGFTREAIHALRRGFRDLFHGAGAFADRLDRVATDHAGAPLVEAVVAFIRGRHGHPLCMATRDAPAVEEA